MNIVPAETPEWRRVFEAAYIASHLSYNKIEVRRELYLAWGSTNIYYPTWAWSHIL
jgi:hypothetical protein